MSRRPGWKPASYSVFKPIADMDALDADLKMFLAREHHAPATRIMYVYLWDQWTAFCRARGWEPLAAPPEAVFALVGASASGVLRRKGKGRKLTGEATRFSPSHLDCWLAAINDAHTREGLVVSWAEPPFADKLSRVRAGYRRWHGCAAGVEANPLTAEGARRILPLALPRTAEDCRRRAAILMALDLGLPAEVLAAVTADHVTDTGDEMVLQLPARPDPTTLDFGASVVLRCTDDDSDRELDPCLHCALAELLARSPAPPGALFVSGAPDSKRAVRQLDLLLGQTARRWQGITYSEHGLVRDDSAAAASPRLRHALALDQQDQGLAHLRARAMVLASWHVGLQGRTARGLLRRDVVLEADRVTAYRRVTALPTSQRGLAFALVASAERQLCAYSALREWLGIRDLATGAGGDDQAVFCRLGRAQGLVPDQPLSNQCTLWFIWRDLQARAGLDGVYSPSSSRSGYTQIALEAGASTYSVQATLNQVKPDRLVRKARAQRLRAGSGTRRLLDWDSMEAER